MHNTREESLDIGRRFANGAAAAGVNAATRHGGDPRDRCHAGKRDLLH